MTNPIHEGLLAPSDVADLAGVSRAAVSNWRKRMSDFPQQAGGSAGKPLFAANDIEAWLSAHPEKRKTATTGSTARQWESRLWGAANRFRGLFGLREFGDIFLQTAVDLVEGRPTHALPHADEGSIGELRAVMDSIPREDLSNAIDGLLERTSRSLGRAAGEHGFVGSRTSSLLSSLASGMRGGTLYDPACGIGVALLQSVALGARPDRLVGHESMPGVAENARRRAVLHGIAIEICIADVLRNDPDPGLRAELIIAEPPLGVRVDRDATMLDPRLRFGIPPRSNSETFWLQHVTAHLAPGGVGYVLTSPGVLSRGGAEAEIRRNLLLSNCVRAIVALPGKMLPQTSIPLVLWVLGGQSPSPRDDVLLIDASNFESPEAEVASWLADEASLAEVPHARVPIDELAAGKSDLSPARWVSTEETDSTKLTAIVDRALEQLLRASVDLTPSVQHIHVPRIAGEVPVVTVDSLVEAGAIEVVAARPPRSGDPDLENRRLDARSVRTRDLVPTSGLPSVKGHNALTQPGDVLVTTVDRARAVVDAEGGHLPVGSVYRIRVLDVTKLDPYYLADVISGDWNLRFAAGTAIQRIPVREIEIPVPTLEDQRGIHESISSAAHSKLLASQATEAVDNLTKALLNSVRYSGSSQLGM